MNKTFKTLDEVNQYVEVKLKHIMRVLMKEVKEELMFRIESNLYTMYPNSDYDNTMQFLNSVDIKFTFENGVASIKCFVNPKKMKLGVDESGWGIHQDMHGQDMRQYMTLWLEKGTEAGLFPRQGAYFIKETIEHYEENFKRILRERLMLRGIPVSVD